MEAKYVEVRRDLCVGVWGQAGLTSCSGVLMLTVWRGPDGDWGVPAADPYTPPRSGVDGEGIGELLVSDAAARLYDTGPTINRAGDITAGRPKLSLFWASAPGCGTPLATRG